MTKQPDPHAALGRGLSSTHRISKLLLTRKDTLMYYLSPSPACFDMSLGHAQLQ